MGGAAAPPAAEPGEITGDRGIEPCAAGVELEDLGITAIDGCVDP